MPRWENDDFGSWQQIVGAFALDNTGYCTDLISKNVV
jgi:hypothetical protein